jgi:hypothetical protein
MSENASIRIGQKNKFKIEVNDNGDYIVLDFSDGTFAKRFYEYANSIKADSEEYAEKVKAISLAARTGNVDENALLEANLELNKKLAAGLDALLGADTCKKVFGHDTPSADSIAELLDALTPFIAEWSRNRNKSITSKYGAQRRGGKA